MSGALRKVREIPPDLAHPPCSGISRNQIGFFPIWDRESHGFPIIPMFVDSKAPWNSSHHFALVPKCRSSPCSGSTVGAPHLALVPKCRSSPCSGSEVGQTHFALVPKCRASLGLTRTQTPAGDFPITFYHIAVCDQVWEL